MVSRWLYLRTYPFLLSFIPIPLAQTAFRMPWRHFLVLPCVQFVGTPTFSGLGKEGNSCPEMAPGHGKTRAGVSLPDGDARAGLVQHFRDNLEKSPAYLCTS